MNSRAAAAILLGLLSCAGPALANSPFRFGFIWVVQGPGRETQDGDYTARKIARNSRLANTAGIASDAAAGDVDVVVHLSWLHEGWTGTALIEAFSNRSHQLLYTAKNPGGSETDIGNMLDDAFSPGAPAHNIIQMEKAPPPPPPPPPPSQPEAATAPADLAVKERPQQVAPPDRLSLIQQAEKEGDQARTSGLKKRALAAYSRALEGSWSDDEVSVRVREKLMALVASGAALPPAPAEERRHAVRARTFLKDARGPRDYELAAEEYMEAISIAPWKASSYYNLALVQEQQGYLKDAMANLKLYLLASPKASDAEEVQDKIYSLEAQIDKSRAR